MEMIGIMHSLAIMRWLEANYFVNKIKQNQVIKQQTANILRLAIIIGEVLIEQGALRIKNYCSII